MAWLIAWSHPQLWSQGWPCQGKSKAGIAGMAGYQCLVLWIRYPPDGKLWSDSLQCETRHEFPLYGGSMNGSNTESAFVGCLFKGGGIIYLISWSRKWGRELQLGWDMICDDMCHDFNQLHVNMTMITFGPHVTTEFELRWSSGAPGTLLCPMVVYFSAMTIFLCFSEDGHGSQDEKPRMDSLMLSMTNFVGPFVPRSFSSSSRSGQRHEKIGPWCHSKCYGWTATGCVQTWGWSRKKWGFNQSKWDFDHWTKRSSPIKHGNIVNLDHLNHSKMQGKQSRYPGCNFLWYRVDHCNRIPGT